MSAKLSKLVITEFCWLLLNYWLICQSPMQCRMQKNCQAEKYFNAEKRIERNSWIFPERIAKILVLLGLLFRRKCRIRSKGWLIFEMKSFVTNPLTRNFWEILVLLLALKTKFYQHFRKILTIPPRLLNLFIFLADQNIELRKSLR